MELSEARECVEMLKKIEGNNALVLFRTVRMLVACCQNDADIGAVMVVRTPADEQNWMLHVQALNLDLDDTYLALAKAAHQIGEHIKSEAPPNEYLN